MPFLQIAANFKNPMDYCVNEIGCVNGPVANFRQILVAELDWLFSIWDLLKENHGWNRHFLDESSLNLLDIIPGSGSVILRERRTWITYQTLQISFESCRQGQIEIPTRSGSRQMPVLSVSYLPIQCWRWIEPTYDYDRQNKPIKFSKLDIVGGKSKYRRYSIE